MTVVGVILVTAGAALVMWGITGRRVHLKGTGPRTAPPDEPGGLTLGTRVTLALAFGSAGIATGILLLRSD